METEQIFPLEVWSIIFTHLRSTKDLITIYEAATVWNELLSPEKMWFLMKEAFPFIFHDRSSTDAFNYQLISPQWEAAVDNFFKHHPAHYDIGISSPIAEIPDHPLFIELTNDDFDKMNRFLYHNRGNNPFAFTRYLSYHETYPKREPFTKNPHKDVSFDRKILIELITTFGSEIWHFDLFLTDEGIGQHKVIRSCLKNLPNLKTASIHVAYGVKYNFVPPTGPTSLGGLVKLSTNLDGILNYDGLGGYSSLQKLHGTPLPPNLELGKLEQLNTTLVRETDLENVRLVKSPLKILKLEATCCNRGVNLPTIFEAVRLASFASTLEEFHLEYYVGEGEETRSRLELPLLTTLNMKVGNHRLENVDFLLPCVHLEYLIIECCASFRNDYRERNRRSAISFMGFETSMYHSNIWERLPNLQIVEIKDISDKYSFTRKNWEDNQVA